MAAIPQDQRDDRDADGRHDRTLIKPVIFVEQQLQRAVTAATRRGLDPPRDRDRCCRQQHDQRQRFDPQLGPQGQWQENRPHQRLPHPAPFVGGLDRKIGLRRCQPAIDEQRDQQKLPPRPAHVALVVGGEPADDRQPKDDQRDRDRIDQKIAQPLRRDDVDVAKAQHKQERPPEPDPDKGKQKGDESQITHCRGRFVRRRGLAATACAG